MTAPAPGPTRTRRLRAPRSPFTYAALAVALVHLTGALPVQLDWAGRAGADADPGNVLDALRLLAVSPVRRFSTARGAGALGLEAVWTACFLFLLTAAARTLTTRTTLPPRDPESAVTRAYAHIAVWPVLAPAAHLLALSLTRLPELSSDPPLRGMTAYSLFIDVDAGLGHAVLLGLIGGFTTATALLALDLDVSDSPPEGARDQLRRLRGPLPTLWSRVGATLLATAVGALVLSLVAGSLPGHVLDPLIRFWCAPSEAAAACAEDLRNLTGLSLPEFPGGEPLLKRFALLYAWQAFLLLFAVTHFAVASLTHALPRTVRAALAGWCGYTAGAIGFDAATRTVSLLWDSPTRSMTFDQMLGLLLPPTGLTHALYTAPFAALLCAALARVRFGRAKGTAASEDDEAAAPEEGAAAPAHGNRLA
ncbi:hypothetical protein [Streptomyces sp. NPDC059080]|uniref:hypothetical protein n=1 Tax=Streptomyces sp. NPDC059080 TaxID=3346718 RepID=UPI0036CCC669